MILTAKLEMVNYNSTDPSELVFHVRNGGWISKDELIRRTQDLLERVYDMIDDGDSLTVTIQVGDTNE